MVQRLIIWPFTGHYRQQWRTVCGRVSVRYRAGFRPISGWGGLTEWVSLRCPDTPFERSDHSIGSERRPGIAGRFNDCLYRATVCDPP